MGREEDEERKPPMSLIIRTLRHILFPELINLELGQRHIVGSQMDSYLRLVKPGLVNLVDNNPCQSHQLKWNDQGRLSFRIPLEAGGGFSPPMRNDGEDIPQTSPTLHQSRETLEYREISRYQDIEIPK
ncbi:hypothetical protein PCH_Pc22g09780 [Penicillium rubens Wisconsin 54-1255]|uniref:Uncharacterized protein n=1 Tax=Penicillium rubens (strain ATCC 28089 / DSM 1075 / NRRL 1951 / Wisconsin 54-1255) TaxID=500485 RepID=B6HUV9_PENRW|nr:hypothetical protein PCH_Pc22g09780 [Penicillium rubens Wisconsin 54-1255]